MPDLAKALVAAILENKKLAAFVIGMVSIFLVRVLGKIGIALTPAEATELANQIIVLTLGYCGTEAVAHVGGGYQAAKNTAAALKTEGVPPAAGDAPSPAAIIAAGNALAAKVG